MTPYQLFINNGWVPAQAGETFESINPYNGDVIGQFARVREADVHKVVAAARAAFNAGPWPRMIGRLTIQYNKARQASITQEILEIVGGAEALA
jgi:acyl-CoA reductase-like NAD-dependent aldehyde dehydrogenase